MSSIKFVQEFTFRLLLRNRTYPGEKTNEAAKTAKPAREKLFLFAPIFSQGIGLFSMRKWFRLRVPRNLEHLISDIHSWCGDIR